MKLPKVSVVTITYAHEKYIIDTIKGVFSQNYDGEIEFIIANDNSPDKTDQTVNAFFNSTIIPNNITIKYIRHNVNKGMMSNFVWTLEQCTGEYIALCEGDDYWINPLKLQKQVDFLKKNTDYSFSMGRVDVLFNITGYIKKIRESRDFSKSKYLTIKDYLKGPFSQTSSFVFRNNKQPFPEWFLDVHAGDQSLVVCKTAKNEKIKYHNELFSIYRINENSISNVASYNVYEKFLETLFKWEDYLGGKYSNIFKIIRLKYKCYINYSKSNNILVKFYFLAKIKCFNLVLRWM